VFLTPESKKLNILIEVMQRSQTLQNVTVTGYRDDIVFVKKAEVSTVKLTPKKLEVLPDEGHSPEAYEIVKERILAKACICHELSGNATIPLGIDPDANATVCCGPGIVDFSKISTLQEMVDHIYGRISLLTSSGRPHVFVKELGLYVEYLRKEIDSFPIGLAVNSSSFLEGMRENLFKGIEYYQTLSGELVEDSRGSFLAGLKTMKEALEPLFLEKAEV
jgi:hypothetical protein